MLLPLVLLSTAVGSMAAGSPASPLPSGTSDLEEKVNPTAITHLIGSISAALLPRSNGLMFLIPSEVLSNHGKNVEEDKKGLNLNIQVPNLLDTLLQPITQTEAQRSTTSTRLYPGLVPDEHPDEGELPHNPRVARQAIGAPRQGREERCPHCLI
ncbi:uncharacterized protein LOC124154949 [Ischnura elegans]|uniref:uncharacterized protein LOC124154949 n=1 Tax=Ischnura elegans TaxID=197161 RepID=UPI001ED8A8EF|nr:uncharacterized protein LOC124154949 [Ischnura elegans]